MKIIISSAALVTVVLSLFYIGISRDLCARDLTPKEYREMQLDCSYWLYR